MGTDDSRRYPGILVAQIGRGGCNSKAPEWRDSTRTSAPLRELPMGPILSVTLDDEGRPCGYSRPKLCGVRDCLLRDCRSWSNRHHHRLVFKVSDNRLNLSKAMSSLSSIIGQYQRRKEAAMSNINVRVALLVVARLVTSLALACGAREEPPTTAVAAAAATEVPAPIAKPAPTAVPALLVPQPRPARTRRCTWTAWAGPARSTPRRLLPTT